MLKFSDFDIAYDLYYSNSWFEFTLLSYKFIQLFKIFISPRAHTNFLCKIIPFFPTFSIHEHIFSPVQRSLLFVFAAIQMHH